MSSSGREAKDTRVRKRTGIVRPVKAPLGGVSFKWYIYTLAVVTLAYSVYYAYRMSEIQRTKAATFQETLRRARGKPPTTETGTNGDDGSPRRPVDVRVTVQEKIEELADMLGVKPVVLASAIADVIHTQMPAESASSIISEANEAQNTGDSVLSALKEGMGKQSTVEPTETSGGVAASVISMVKQD